MFKGNAVDLLRMDQLVGQVSYCYHVCVTVCVRSINKTRKINKSGGGAVRAPSSGEMICGFPAAPHVGMAITETSHFG